MKINYQMRFSKTGRARFIAHLDTLSCLVRAVRRTGFKLAFTEGMRPKPILSLAMPLGVGIEGEDEICDFSLQQRAPLSELAKKLSRELPEGLELISLGPSMDRTKSASRVESVSYRIEFADDNAGDQQNGLVEAINRYNNEESLVITRTRPKGDKDVDLKKFVETVTLQDAVSGIAFTMSVTAEGTARPEEIVTAIREYSGEQLPVARIVRTGIKLKEEALDPRPGGKLPGQRR